MDNLDDRAIHFICYGSYYGYPECCIDSFIDMKHIKRGIVHPIADEGWGYIPCETCMSKSRQELIDAINAKRIHPIPFPTLDDKPR